MAKFKEGDKVKINSHLVNDTANGATGVITVAREKGEVLYTVLFDGDPPASYGNESYFEEGELELIYA
jgi:hypothetical protein